MSNELLKAFDFPQVPDKEIIWTPVFMEPVHGSGEKITVAIAIDDGNGPIVSPVLSQEKLKCLLGEAGPRFEKLVDILCSDIHRHLSNNLGLSEWAPIFENASLGRLHAVRANSAEDIVRQAAMMSSAFVAMPVDSQEDDQDIKEITNERKVADLVIKKRPGLKDFFGVECAIKHGGRKLRIGFAGKRYAVNIGSLRPGSGSGILLHVAKSKIVDLATLRRHDKNHPLSTATSTFDREYEMLLFTPPENSPLYNDKQMENFKAMANQLEFIGDEEEVYVVKMGESFDAAADRILMKEAA